MQIPTPMSPLTSPLPWCSISHPINVPHALTHCNGQLIIHINADQTVANVAHMTLIPCGTDKHIVDKQKANMSNSGVTIMKLLEMEHLLVKPLENIVECYKMDGTRY